MLLGAEAMFFAGLIGAFLVFRFGSTVWPPPFQPRLPIGVTGINTLDSAGERGDYEMGAPSQPHERSGGD